MGQRIIWDAYRLFYRSIFSLQKVESSCHRSCTYNIIIELYVDRILSSYFRYCNMVAICQERKSETELTDRKEVYNELIMNELSLYTIVILSVSVNTVYVKVT